MIIISALDTLTSKQKAAILLVSLPPEVSSQVFKEFGQEEVQAISQEISSLPQISPEVRAQVVEEFMHTSTVGGGVSLRQGSMTAAMSTEAFNPATAFLGDMDSGRATMSMEQSATGKPFEFLHKVEARQILSIMKKEHPQTIALVLKHLPASLASSILGELPTSTQTEVASRLAEMSKVTKEIIEEVERVIENKLYAAIEGEYESPEGKDVLVNILSQADRSLEDGIMRNLAKKQPEIASNIKDKLCDFEDLLYIDEKSLQQVLRLTDIRDLVLALKKSRKDLADRIYNAFSPDMAKALKEESQALGQVTQEEIKSAQHQIRNILRGLITLGKVKLNK